MSKLFTLVGIRATMLIPRMSECLSLKFFDLGIFFGDVEPMRRVNYVVKIDSSSEGF